MRLQPVEPGAMTTSLKDVLSEPVLRRMAEARSFEKGTAYFCEGRVTAIVEKKNGIAAKVRGSRPYWVQLWVERNALDYSCSCPIGTYGEFCKHCVALGLAWLEQSASGAGAALTESAHSKGKKSSVTMQDVRTYLSAQKPSVLVDLLLEHAEQDEILRRRLMLLAATKTGNGPDIITYMQAIEDAIIPDGFVEYEEMYDYERSVDQVVESLEDLLKEGHTASVVELAEHALRSVEKAIESVDDSDGYLGDMLERLQDLHHTACKRSKPDPQALAKRLFEWALHGEWDIFSDAVVRYADILGKEGLEVYRRLAEERWARVRPLGPGGREPAFYGKRFRITQIMEVLARLTGDVEAIVAVKQRDLSSTWSYLQIAEVYQKAKKHDLAMQWAERGVKAFPQERDGRLTELLAAEYHRRRRHDEAMALVWADFEAMPQLEEYRKLRSHADQVGQWPRWRQKALELIRVRIEGAKRNARGRNWIIADHSVLVEIFLWEKDFESAWREARAGGCRDDLWRTLAVWLEKDHPQDAIPIYRKDVDGALKRMGNESYREAVRLLRKIHSLMRRMGQQEQFKRELAELRAAHKAKRNFMKLLDHEKWA